ncbi:MAG: hypothetical protein HZC51_07600 [Nitrospirae bacterium]|nr:hypothetical protein [Nitrospirota bacterium]
MRRLLFSVMICFGLLALTNPAHAEENRFALTSHTGNLIRGTVYKYSGADRTGVVTIRLLSKLPGESPVLRYDFDMMYGTIEGTLYSYLMGDIAEIQFMPIEDGEQPANIILRNGLAQRIILSTRYKSIIGPLNLTLTEVMVETDGYGENYITGGDVQRIVFDAPDKVRDSDMERLVSDLGGALAVGRRDKLVDEEFLKVLENIQSLMKSRLGDGKKE